MNYCVTQDVTQDGTQDGTQAVNGEDIRSKIKKMIIEDSSVTTENIADKLGVSTRTVKRYIKQMPEIRYMGSGYSGHWRIED